MLIPGGGTELFRALLDKEGIQPVHVNELNNMWGGSDDLIVIVIGSPNPFDWQRDPLRWTRMAIQANGAALIASDNGFLVSTKPVANRGGTTRSPASRETPSSRSGRTITGRVTVPTLSRCRQKN